MPEEAHTIIKEHFTATPVGVEKILVTEAYGRVLAEDVVSRLDVPSFSRSKVDGYAVSSADTFGAEEHQPVTLKVLGHISAGSYPRLKVKRGAAAGIATGAPIPTGADAVVMVEFTSREGNMVKIYRPVAPNANILERGFDIKAGETILKFQQLSASDLGVLSAIGLKEVKVFKKPKVAVISTGDEVVEPSKPLPSAKVYDVNRSTIAASVSICGCKPIIFGIVRDDPAALKHNLKKALTKAEVVITSGATSVGVEDYMPKILNELGKPGVIVGGLATKPGKPTNVAVVNGKPVFALPGHPASGLIVFNLLVRPVLCKMAGLPAEVSEPKVLAKAAARIFPEKGRRTYMTVRLERGLNGELLAHPIPAESGAITTLAKADGFIEIPETREFIEKDEKVVVHLLRAKSF